MTVASWSDHCTLREDVRTGTLSLDEFAADLNGVRTGESPPVYRDAELFFSRTYPTYRMRELVRGVLLRLAGQGGKPVQQLQVAYGGGKTHTLVTLLHLAERGPNLKDQPTVQEFITFTGLPRSPQAVVALLPFDKFDIEEGLEVQGPARQKRRVHTPWGALAYQLAGDVGYARLKAHDDDFTVPAEPLLVDLLRAPQKKGYGSLVLVDEAVWYYRGMVNRNPRMLGTIKDFYQVLTQAVAKVDRAALVAGLIASKVEANDATGFQCLAALEDIFGRIAEPIEPVTREDVAEVLRRRLFETVPGETERRPAVDAVMASYMGLPLRDSQCDQAAYDRMMASYPFHPDLVDVLYQKWTQYDQFQRTRGALRLLAYALRDAAGRDPSPLIGPWAFLSADGPALSPALNQLIPVCQEREKWGPILAGELEKAREIQAGLPSLRSREIEQAVVATFLHSHPPGQRAAPSELLVLLAHPGIDAAAVEEGLRKWRGISWFLVEDTEVWRLSTHPNLNHIHIWAMEHLSESGDVDPELRRRIGGLPTLRGADDGVVVHVLPATPADVPDNLQLHYLVLGPECALEPGKPLPSEVESYCNEVTGPQNPRIYRNNIVAVAPEASRLAGLREQVRRWLGWGRIETTSEYYKLLTDYQKKQLPRRKRGAADGLPEAVLAAYTLLMSVDENGQVVVQTLRAEGATAFERVKATLDREERILLTTLDPDLLLPGSYLDLWGADEKTKRVASLMEAFGQFTRLPRLLRPEALYDSLKRGVEEGAIVLRLVRGDGSVRSFWRIAPDDETLRRPDLELQAARQAALHDVDAELLRPGELGELWPDSGGPASLAHWRRCFDGERFPQLLRIDVLDEAVRTAVRRGNLLARIRGAAFLGEDLPDGPLPGDAELLAPPEPLRGMDLAPEALPEAWHGERTTLEAIAESLACRWGYRLPWLLIGDAVDEALRLGLFERTADSGPWPCSRAALDEVEFQAVERVAVTPEAVVAAFAYASSPTPTLQELRDAVEGSVLGREVPEAQFLAGVREAVDARLVLTEYQPGAISLGTRVYLPSRVAMADGSLAPSELQALADAAQELLATAPDLEFTFRVVLTAKGQRLGADALAELNGILRNVRADWKLELH